MQKRRCILHLEETNTLLIRTNLMIGVQEPQELPEQQEQQEQQEQLAPLVRCCSKWELLD